MLNFHSVFIDGKMICGGQSNRLTVIFSCHDDVIWWKHFPRYWPFVRGIHRSPVNSPHKGQWRGALIFSLICAWINGWVNSREAGDSRHQSAHYDVTVMTCSCMKGDIIWLKVHLVYYFVPICMSARVWAVAWGEQLVKQNVNHW